MKKTLKGYLTGVISTLVILGGIAYATTGSEMIEVVYNNIKVYKDNILCDLKDSNGTTVEPFIYNGSTYVPLRAISEALGVIVDWDGDTQTINMYDDIIPGETYLMNVCPPYQGHRLKEYHISDGDFFTMGGEKYSNGFVFTHTWDAYALINLNGKYSSLTLDVGNVPRSYSTPCVEYTISFIVDNQIVETYTLDSETLPKKIEIPLNKGLKLKICTSGNLDNATGFGNITLK